MAKNNTGNAGTPQIPASTPAGNKVTVPAEKTGAIRDNIFGNTKKSPGLGTQPIERGQSGIKK